MAKTIDNWLGPLIEDELRAVLAWKNSVKHGIKLEPGTQSDNEGRFRDDGSNFHSTLTTPPLSPTSKLQLRKVFEVNDGARVLLSDGFTQITAFLHQPALRALEEATGEELTTDMAGDVFVLRSANVISTPYGDSDMHVLLVVMEIEYLSLLRKIIGDSPIPVQERQDVSKSLETIRELRIGALDILGEADSQVQAASQIEQNHEQQTSPLGTKRARPSSQSSSEIETQFLETQIQAQASPPSRINRKKRIGAQLTNDGYEVETGINLNRPTAANRSSTAAGATRSRKPANLPDVVTTGPSTLLSLLKPKTVEPAPMPTLPSDVLTQKSPMPTHPTSAQQLHESSAPASQPRVPYGRRKIPKEQQRVLDKPESWFPARPGKQFPIPNVPIELLQLWSADKSSQIPTSPKEAVEDARNPESPRNMRSPSSSSLGSSSSDEEIINWTPTPERPQRPELPPDSTLGSNRSPVAAASQHLPIRSPEKMPSSPLKPRSQAEPYSPVPQPTRSPHPLPKRPDFLPSSGSGHVSNRSSQHSQGAQGYPKSNSQSAPQYSSARESPQAHYECPICNESFIRQNDMKQHILKHMGDNPFACDVVGCGQKFARSDHLRAHEKSHQTVGSPSGSMRQSQSFTEQHRSSPVIHSSGGRQSHYSNEPSEDNTMKTPAKFSQSQPRLSQSSPQFSTQHTIIKATQLSPVDDDMEMDVPRPYEDPTIDHRRKRREFFKQQWLIDNFEVVHESKPYFREVLDAYRRRFPNDMNAADGLLNAIHEAFPTLRESAFPKSLRPKPLPRTNQSQSKDSGQPIIPPPIALDGADETQEPEHSADRSSQYESFKKHHERSPSKSSSPSLPSHRQSGEMIDESDDEQVVESSPPARRPPASQLAYMSSPPRSQQSEHQTRQQHSTVFSEYYKSWWTNVRGADHLTDEDLDEYRPHSAKRLNILSWIS